MERESSLIVGIDWSRDQHQINLFNENGEALIRFVIAHTQSGFTTLKQKLDQFGLKPDQIKIGIETKHNQLVDFLHAQGYSIYVIAPSVVRANRSRQSHAGAKNDSKDADLIADILRTDRRRLSPWQPDDRLTQKIRYQLSLLDDLTKSIVQAQNQLEAQLCRYFPQMIGVFSGLTTQIALKTLIEFPTPSAVALLELPDFQQFCHQNQYRQTALIPKRFAALKRDTPYDDPDAEYIFASAVPLLARRLLNEVQLKAQLVKEIDQLFLTHPDAPLYQSLPGAGEIIAPKLLAIFGDRRDRYPSPDLVRALAGTCPATSQSGKKWGVFFRRACNHTWRNAFQLLAHSSVSYSDWAAVYFEQARLRGHRKSHAYRCLANRWVGIIWTMWQRNVPYDESLHLRNVNRFRNKRRKQFA